MLKKKKRRKVAVRVFAEDIKSAYLVGLRDGISSGLELGKELREKVKKGGMEFG
jgi:hypothetical protein